jgi:HSP20 family molecular chaperone IbpA
VASCFEERAFFMTRLTFLSSPFLLGFDQIERLIDRASKSSGDGYPPYNIERSAASDDHGERLRITLAVAGFRREDLEVSLEENQLVIRGRQTEDEARTYLHRGIAARQFQRAFVLADGMEVSGANLENGLLSIDLARPASARIVRKVEIASR